MHKPVCSSMAKESGDNKMEAFYASLKAEISSPSHVQDSKHHNLSVRTKPSENSQKVMNNLRGLVSKNFSVMLHPTVSSIVKFTITYFLILPADEEFSMRTKSLILQLSQSFDQWILDYKDAKLKLDSVTADLSEAVKVKDDLQANVQDFEEVDMEEKRLCDQLGCLQKEKRDLKEKINAKKMEIANVKELRDKVAKRKIKVFDNGRVIKAKRDNLRKKEPRLKAEQECTKITQVNIEVEWLKLGKQLIESLENN